MAEEDLPGDDERARVGLCVRCVHVRVTRNDRGSAFFLCRLSESDPRYPRYPRLPVVRCEGHVPTGVAPPY